MKHRLNRRAKKAMMAGAAASGLLALAIPVAAMAEMPDSEQGSGSHCTSDVSGGPVKCFTTYRAAIAAATGGVVKDAPANVSDAAGSPGFKAKINAAGTTAADGDQPFVVGTVYLDNDLKGASMSFTAETKCSPENDGFQISSMPEGFDDAVSSYETFNDCQAALFSDPDLNGDHSNWQIGRQTFVRDGLDNLASSMRFTYAESPSVEQLVKDCDEKVATCKFEQKGDVRYGFSGTHEVARGYNCTTVPQQTKIAWWDATGGKNSLEVELGASYKIGNSVLGSEFSYSFKIAYGHEWNWQNTAIDETPITVPAGQVGWINRNTKMQTSGGTLEVKYDDPKWGHRLWYVDDFTATGPTPEKHGTVTWAARKMTAAEKAEQCTDGSGFVTEVTDEVAGAKAKRANAKSAPAKAKSAPANATVSSGKH
ncbi:hypothetical protein OG241_32480 [Streptomyces sp. NBC_01390]|uniref:hypothetical protein n=1 Tax=Streptomyces sp. NBC_01390 TaxID=2903850 RepID=UPI00324EE1F2